MACGLIKASLLVLLCVTFVRQTSALRGRCINPNSAKNVCNCELYSNTVEYSEGSMLVADSTFTAEEFRPRVVGNRFLRKSRNYITDCITLCLNHLRAKLQQPNVAEDLTENEVPSSTFLTPAGKDGLCEWLFNDPVAAAPPATVDTPGPTQYYFLKASRPCKNKNTLSKFTYIGNADCECYLFGGMFQRCFSTENLAIAGVSGAIALIT